VPGIYISVDLGSTARVRHPRAREAERTGAARRGVSCSHLLAGRGMAERLTNEDITSAETDMERRASVNQRKSAFACRLLAGPRPMVPADNYDKAGIMSIFYVTTLAEARINYQVAGYAGCDLFP